MKKLAAFFLTAVMLLTMLPATALAVTPGLGNFKTENTYSPGQFKDVASSAWYSENVSSAYQMGLMVGNSDTTFNPSGNITQAETLTIASRLHKIYNTGNDDFSAIRSEMDDRRSEILEWVNHDTKNPGYLEFYNAWYSPNVYYLHNHASDDYPIYPFLGAAPDGAPFIDSKTPITRREFVYFLAMSLPEYEFQPINKIANGDIPDISYDDSPETYLLYRAGVLTGNDKYGTFSPGSYITRAEVSAIISRVVNPSLRKDVTLVDKPEVKPDANYTIDGRIQIYGTYIKVNSADGVNVYIQWENLSEKEIKYIYFNVELYNRVHDTLSCDITGDRAQWLYQTGPIPTGKGNYNSISISSSDGAQRPFQPDVSYDVYKDDDRNGWEGQYWDCIWYNSQAYYAKIIGVEIEYMDGTVFKENRRAVFDNSDIINLTINDEVYEYAWEYPVSAELLPKDFPYSSFNSYIDSLIIDSVTGVGENEALFTCRLTGRSLDDFLTICVNVVDEYGNRVNLTSTYVDLSWAGDFTTNEFYISTPIEGTYYLEIDYVL